MKYLLTVLAIACMHCASTLPKDQREVVKVHDITGPKKVLFNRALEFFAKNMGNANQAIQIKDPERGKIVTNGYVNCSALNGMRYGMSSAQNINFVVDVTVKDNKVRVVFENITHTSKGNSMEIDQGPSSAEQVQEIMDTCLAPIETSLLSTLKGGGSSRSDNF